MCTQRKVWEIVYLLQTAYVWCHADISERNWHESTSYNRFKNSVESSKKDETIPLDIETLGKFRTIGMNLIIKRRQPRKLYQKLFEVSGKRTWKNTVLEMIWLWEYEQHCVKAGRNNLNLEMQFEKGKGYNLLCVFQLRYIINYKNKINYKLVFFKNKHDSKHDMFN